MSAVISLLACLTACDDGRVEPVSLDGAWQACGNVTQDAVSFGQQEPRFQLLFRGDKVVWLTDDKKAGIPKNGAEFDAKIDLAKTPNRLALTFDEPGGKAAFVYCIFQRSGDRLMLKMLLPLGLASNGDKEDFERFVEDPYPRDFRPPERAKFESLILFEKTADVLPVPKRRVTQSDTTDRN